MVIIVCTIIIFISAIAMYNAVFDIWKVEHSTVIKAFIVGLVFSVTAFASDVFLALSFCFNVFLVFVVLRATSSEGQ